MACVKRKNLPSGQEFLLSAKTCPIARILNTLLLLCFMAACHAFAIVVKETTDDEAVSKLVEKAAVETAARTAQGGVLPQVEMREGQQQFAATSGLATKQSREPVTTEAAVVAPPLGVGAGDRLVNAKAEKSKKMTKTSPAKAAKVRLFVVSFVQHAVLVSAAWNVLMAKTQQGTTSLTLHCRTFARADREILEQCTHPCLNVFSFFPIYCFCNRPVESRRSWTSVRVT